MSWSGWSSRIWWLDAHVPTNFENLEVQPSNWFKHTNKDSNWHDIRITRSCILARYTDLSSKSIAKVHLRCFHALVTLMRVWEASCMNKGSVPCFACRQQGIGLRLRRFISNERSLSISNMFLSLQKSSTEPVRQRCSLSLTKLQSGGGQEWKRAIRSRYIDGRIGRCA